MHRRFLGSVPSSSRTTAMFALALALALPARARGQDYETPRLLGLGGAARALATGNDALFVNPAALTLGTLYSVELGYADDLRGSDRRFNASIADSQAGPIAGAISYTYLDRRPEDLASGAVRLTGHRFDVALATPVGEGVSLGVTGRYFMLDRKDGDTSLDSLKELTVDAGLLWHGAGGLSIGAAGYNLTKSSRPELPIGWGAGIGYAGDAFTLEGDVRYNAQKGKAAYTGAASYVVAHLVPLRAAVTYDLAIEKLSISAGAGVALEKFFIDLGYRQVIGADGTAEDRDARLFGVAIRGLFM